MSLYGASKAFVLSYSEGLWAECRDQNVKVLALCPGPVDTAFFAAAGDAALRDEIPAGMMMQADVVAAYALRALARGDAVAVPRSEEHTSELPSLMRISYSVFCLKKKH